MANRILRLLSILLIIQLLLAGTAAWLIFFYPSDGQSGPASRLEQAEMAKFDVSSGKSDLEKAINGYLQRKFRSDDLACSVELGDNLRFKGDVRIAGRKVRLEVGFSPEVQENGDLLLKQQFFKLGGLKLPRSLVLEYVKRNYAFPEWIVLQPSRRQVLLATTAMTTESGMVVRVRDFDLASDKLRYEVWLP